jgi:hypothetical protein
LKFGILRFEFSSAVHVESSSSFFVLGLLPFSSSCLISQFFSSDWDRDELQTKPAQVSILQDLLPSRLPERASPGILFGSGVSAGQ